MTVLQTSDVTLEFGDMAKRIVLARPTKNGYILEPKRKPGVHLSGVLRYVAVAIGKLKPGEDFEEEMPLRVGMGHAWEEFAASFYPNMDWQPGERVVDGIAMNCDGISVELSPGQVNFTRDTDGNQLPVLEEFKCTWKKIRDASELETEWYWMSQGKCYLHGYDLAGKYGGFIRWHVMFVMGDYKGGGPVYRQYLVHFTKKEIDQAWKMVLNNREGAKEEIGK